MPRYMNPFWFVPMDGRPALRLPLGADGWGVWGPTGDRRHPPISGRIRLRMKTLTPLHVLGASHYQGNGACFFREAYRSRCPGSGSWVPAVDGASIRGAVRSYVEALTNSMAGAYLTGHEDGGTYDKRDGRVDGQNGRHVGSWIGPQPDAGEPARAAFDETITTDNGHIRHLYGDRDGPYVNDRPAHVFQPRSFGDLLPHDPSRVKVDAATLLFGSVSTRGLTGERDPRTGRAPCVALASRVRFEEVRFLPRDLTTNPSSLDLVGDAFFGGAKLRQNSWWYFKPDHVRRRLVNGNFEALERVGLGLRGRKFYFHQRPDACVQWYLDHWGGGNGMPLLSVSTECIKAGATSNDFHIFFRELPPALVRLLVVSLTPSCRVRHKVGALKAFGFGSVELEVLGVEVERCGPSGLKLNGLGDYGWHVSQDLLQLGQTSEGIDSSEAENRELSLEIDSNLNAQESRQLCCEDAWERLRLISCCPVNLEEHPDRLFVYPAFGNVGGTPAKDRFNRVLGPNVALEQGAQRADASPEVREAVCHHRSTSDIDYYQTTADNYQEILASHR